MHSTSLFVILSLSWNNNNWSKLSTNAGCETQEFMQWTGLCPQVMGFLCKSKLKHNRLHSCQHMQWWGENGIIAPCVCIVFFTLHYGMAEGTWCISWSLPQVTGGEDVLRQAVAGMFLSAAELLPYSEWGRLKEQPQNGRRSCCDRIHLPERSQEVQSLSGHFDQCSDANCPCKVLCDTCALSPFMYSGKCLFLRLIMGPFVSW